MVRDCCAAFSVPNSGPQEHLLWDSWKTTEAILAEATSGHLPDTCASRSKFNSDMNIKLDFTAYNASESVCQSSIHCTALFANSSLQLLVLWTRPTCSDSPRSTSFVGLCLLVQQSSTSGNTVAPGSHPPKSCWREWRASCTDSMQCDPDGVSLFKPSMLKVWRIQRVHILRGCLSDPEVGEGILYRHGGTVQLNHVKGEGAAVPLWIPVRGTSQQEGFHFHQAKWVTGTQVSTELFQVQGMTGVARWNFQRLVDLKLPKVKLPAVFNPVLIMQLNKLSEALTGQAKYPVLRVSHTDTGERFGLHYLEPGCRPVPLDWDKHKSQKVPVAGEGEHRSDLSALCEVFTDDAPEEVFQDDRFGVACQRGR